LSYERLVVGHIAVRAVLFKSLRAAGGFGWCWRALWRGAALAEFAISIA